MKWTCKIWLAHDTARDARIDTSSSLKTIKRCIQIFFHYLIITKTSEKKKKEKKNI